MIIKPIKIITKDAEQIAQGNLSFTNNLLIYANKEHEIGILSATFINLCDNMRKLIYDIKSSVEQINTSCTELEGNAKYVETSSEQSYKATQQINGLITDIQRGITETHVEMYRTEVVIGEQEKSVEQAFISFEQMKLLE